MVLNEIFNLLNNIRGVAQARDGVVGCWGPGRCTGAPNIYILCTMTVIILHSNAFDGLKWKTKSRDGLHLNQEGVTVLSKHFEEFWLRLGAGSFKSKQTHSHRIPVELQRLWTPRKKKRKCNPWKDKNLDIYFYREKKVHHAKNNVKPGGQNRTFSFPMVSGCRDFLVR